MDLQKFHQFTTTIRRAKKADFYGSVLALDPGETTGYAILNRTPEMTSLASAGQIKTWPMPHCVTDIGRLFEETKPNFLVYESYHIYSWKTQQHTHSEVATIQVIGSIQTLAILQGLPYATQSAQIGKEFCTDSKLEGWNLWLPGLRHARDAIRHACYFLLFGKPNIQL